MGRSLDQVIAELPPTRREEVEARYRALRRQIERLGGRRQIAGEVLADMTADLKTR